ncbi:cyclic GMP-AMP synthase-like receptor isoform X1 [Frankliniella occidentalis]|uniref:Cyclic GMP-AMP synthase-like receptor isoform X1 n=1 Tax=Frankliniella occidentalis TaxID=133901 RepID=A0A6J1S5Z9_FRAOC|nr:cyclic GMP-AMP synthase-like receptor isoform X1 [Frankliniella occidentalis]
MIPHNFNNQGGGGRGRGRGQPNQGINWDTVATVAAGAAALGGTIYLANRYFNSGENEPQTTSASTAQAERPSSSSNFGFLDPRRLLFWENVEQLQNEEVACIKQTLAAGGQMESGAQLAQPESLVRKFRHPYNKFDEWFENLLKDSLKIDRHDKIIYEATFKELLDTLIPAMKRADPLFNFLYREHRPAGSTWENLRICNQDEFDVNVLLFPPDVQADVKVVDLNSGHIGVVLPRGFTAVKTASVVKKCKVENDLTAERQVSHITKKLKQWLDVDGFIMRSEVLKWMTSVVDTALNEIENKQWENLRRVARSWSGPAITINVTMNNGKTLSVDLVPALEFSLKLLPEKIRATVNKHPSKGGVERKWYAIPKGSKNSSDEEWRTSLYEIERDLMSGKTHVKPSIRIMKKLRDTMEWKGLSSYYIKTMFMWMMQSCDLEGKGLGQMIMKALEILEEHMREGRIKYYWDDSLNLLDNVDNPIFFRNVSNCIKHILKKFQRSLEDDSVDPMVYFGCRKSLRYFPECGMDRSNSWPVGQEDRIPQENTADESCHIS